MGSDVWHWPQTDQVWRQFDQFDLVMERTSVDPVLAARKEAGRAIAQARNICLACLHQKRCRALLAHDEPGAVLAFCPNAGFFDQCRRRGLRKNRTTKRGT